MLSIAAIEGLPEVPAGADLAGMLAQATRAQLSLTPDSILVIAQKVISKAEGRLVSLDAVKPGEAATGLAAEVNKDPRLVELILSESIRVVRKAPGLLIVEHRAGHILANAGIDSSNIPQSDDDQKVLLWPADPDASARELAQALSSLLDQHIPVIINDSIGRPWRYGTVGHAIGSYGIEPLWNQIGETDRFGNVLRVTEPATADGLAAAAALVQGEAAQGLPAVWVQGYPFRRTDDANSTALLRSKERDLFR